jgi:hypothetical protein
MSRLHRYLLRMQHRRTPKGNWRPHAILYALSHTIVREEVADVLYASLQRK